MRVLFYLYPGLLSQGPEFSGGWSTLMLRIMRGLVTEGGTECRMVTALRFQPLLEPGCDGLLIHYLDDLELYRSIRAHDPRSAIPTELSRQARSPAGGPGAEILAQWMRNACGDFVPDVVVTFSLQAPYARKAWPAATVLHVEAGAFSRDPYPYTLFFDHRGMYLESVAAGVSGASVPASEDALSLARDFQAHAAAELARTDPFTAFDLRARFPRLALLPLQVSSFFSFDEQSLYRTQFEFLCDVMACAPADVGVVVTEYVQWGEVLKAEGSGANLEWLRRTFPNFLFHESFRRFASPSQYLVTHVDGVLSVASNLGYQALLHGKRLWASAGSYLGNVAHDSELPRFFARLGTPAAERTRFLAWYLERYAVPESLFSDGAWLAGYLERRLAAIASAQRPEEGFVPIDAPDVLRSAWLAPGREARAERFATPTQRRIHRAVVADIEGARTQAMAAAAPLAATGSRGGYVLLNDTRALDGYLHLGRNAVTRHIEKRMADAGLECLGRANDGAQCGALMAGGDLARRARLVVFNGEGLVRDDVPRIRELLEFCRALGEQGVPCVLLNSSWDRDTAAALGKLLEGLALVTVRDSASLEAIRAWRPDARRVPDIAFAAFHDVVGAFAGEIPLPTQRSAFAVLDSVDVATARTLGDFAAFHEVPFYLMGRLHVEALAAAEEAGYSARGFDYPRILRSPAELGRAGGCLTGRYHGFVAAMCAGVPLAALPSTTHKIEALAVDAGLGDQVLLEAGWLQAGHHHQRVALEQRLSAWNAEASRSVSEYVATARQAIEQLFKDISDLQAEAPRRPARKTAR